MPHTSLPWFPGHLE